MSDCTVALNTWNTTRYSEDLGRREDTTDKDRTAQTPRSPVKGKQTDLDMMDLDNINLEEVGMDESLNIYEKMWEASALNHSVDMPEAFRVGLFLKAISRRQKKAVELLGTLCRAVSVGWAWVVDSILSTNLRLADIEAQGVSCFLECKEHVRTAVEQIQVAEISVKTLQQELI